MSEGILNRNFRKEKLCNKREIFSNNVSKIERYMYNLKEILRMGEN